MATCIDLSATMMNYSMDPNVPKITHIGHAENQRKEAKKLGVHVDQVGPCGATDHVVTLSHANTHVDAPWHFGPIVEGKPAKTIDQVPLEWCFGNGVLLDFSTSKKPGELISVDDIKRELQRINHTLSSLDIVLIRTGAEEYFDRDPRFATLASGLGKESLMWLLDQGIKHMATDAYTLDIPIPTMCEELKKGNKAAFFPVHLAGREKEYLHSEKFYNLKNITRPTGFKVAVFPIKIEHGAGAWTRPVAIEGEGSLSAMPELIDLSVPLMNQSMEKEDVTICHLSHEEGARRLSKTYGISCDMFPLPHILFANDEVSCSTHAGTHLNAPWHYAPVIHGKPAKTIDQISLDLCYGNAVLLDFSSKKAHEPIMVRDIKTELDRIGHTLNRGDIVLMRTGAEERFFTDPRYEEMWASLSGEALVWLWENGVTTIGTDSGNPRFFPVHAVPPIQEFCFAEKLCNLKNLPRPSGFTVTLFPIKLEQCSAAWTRAVAIL